MTALTIPFLITIFSLSRVWGISPKIFVPVSSAKCLAEYTWMNNAKGQDPCTTVAYVIAACVGDTWLQPALSANQSYDAPSGATVTPCYCSRSCYNLMMGCTVCQNPAYADDILTWPSFSQNCPASYSANVFPQGYVLADNGSSIPYWATINPANWTSELFSVEQAESYANQSQPNYYPSASSTNLSSSSSGSSIDLGAIVGGTIGGAAALLLILIGGYCLYKRRHYGRLRSTDDSTAQILKMTPMTGAHTRWTSDPSTIFTVTSSATQPSRMGMETNTLPQNPWSPFPVASPPPPTETESFFTTGNTVVQRSRAIPMV